MKRSVYYVPGLLSLSLALPLFMFLLYHWSFFKKERVLEVTWCDPKITAFYNQKLLPERNFYTIKISGDKSNDEVKIKYAEILISEIAQSLDTVNGVRVHFADNSHYDYFVRVLRICQRNAALTHVPWGNNIWIYNPYKTEFSRNLSRWSCIVLPAKMTNADTINRYSGSIDYDADPTLWVSLVLLTLLGFLGLRKF